jgi:hypothetical protein
LRNSSPTQQPLGDDESVVGEADLSTHSVSNRGGQDRVEQSGKPVIQIEVMVGQTYSVLVPEPLTGPSLELDAAKMVEWVLLRTVGIPVRPDRRGTRSLPC